MQVGADASSRSARPGSRSVLYAGGEPDGHHDARRRARRRPADAVPVGHAAGARRCGAAADRRPLGRAGRRVRRAQAARRRPVGSATRRPRLRRAGPAPTMQTEVFPLTLFALGGMMIFVAANDLLTMFVALEVLLAAAVPDVRAGPAPAAAVPGGGGQVLPARRVRLGVLPLRPGAALRLRGLGAARRHRDRRRPGSARSRRAAVRRARAARRRPAVQGARSARSTSGRRTSTRARRPRSPRSWRPAPRWPRSARMLRVLLRRRSATPAGTGAAVLWADRGRCRWWSARCSASPRPTSSGCSPTRRSPTPASCWSGCWPSRRRASRRTLFYLLAYGFTMLARVRVITLVRDADGEATHLSQWAGPGASGRRWSPAC